MKSTIVALTAGILLVAGYPTVGPTSTLTISNEILAPDGFERSTTVVNGIFPGPLIKAKKGDKFKLKVDNRLNDVNMLRSTSVHWHGIFQDKTNWADGVSGVSQCPISPNHTFTYQFTGYDQAGTFWYHSHFGTQYCDGLRGPMVVYDPQDPHRSLYDVDDDTTVITVGEWYHRFAAIVEQAIAIADATLINGKGRYVGGPEVDLAIMNVKRGKRYRFRLISVACDPNYIFSIDNHPMTIIEVDGEATKPHTVDSLRIFTGQRYSFVLNANQPVDNYWVRALPSTGNSGLSNGFKGGLNSAILRYHGAPARDPTSKQKNGSLLQEWDLVPLTNPAAPGGHYPGGADLTFNLTFQYDEPSFRFFINNLSWVSPSVPVLLQILSGAKKAQDLLPQGSVFTLPRNKVIEINMPGGLIGGPHPFHLHGHSFSVIKSAESPGYNYINPPRRDVVAASNFSDIVSVRFVTDNTGPWFFHCHIDWHLEMGLAVVFAEDTGETPNDIPVPDTWKDLCPIYDSLPPSATYINMLPHPSSHQV